jgi:hypothetical protein
MHAPHDPNSEAILQDNCERCYEQAVSLVSLDDTKLKRLWSKMQTVEFSGEGHYDSVAEATACTSLYRTFLMMKRMGLVASPDFYKDMRSALNVV